MGWPVMYVIDMAAPTCMDVHTDIIMRARTHTHMHTGQRWMHWQYACKLYPLNGSLVKTVHASHLWASHNWPLLQGGCIIEVDFNGSVLLVLFGAKKDHFLEEVAALYSDHYRQVTLYTQSAHHTLAGTTAVVCSKKTAECGRNW